MLKHNLNIHPFSWSGHLPKSVLGNVKASGKTGEQWLKNLDNTIAALENKWDVKVKSCITGGSRAFVGAAVTKTGTKFVIKIEIPDRTEKEFLQSVKALDLANGCGYCKIFLWDKRYRAVLMEHLGEPLRLSGLSPKSQMRIVCDVLKTTWKLSTDGLPNGNYKWFEDFLPKTFKELGKPCDYEIIKTALLYLDKLKQDTDPTSYVNVHGDAHNNNLLEVPNTKTYKFIDPDGLSFEKSYDLGVLMREWLEEYDLNSRDFVKQRAYFLSKLTGVESRKIFQWGFIQLVTTALILLKSNRICLAEHMLEVSKAIININ